MFERAAVVVVVMCLSGCGQARAPACPGFTDDDARTLEVELDESVPAIDLDVSVTADLTDARFAPSRVQLTVSTLATSEGVSLHDPDFPTDTPHVDVDVLAEGDGGAGRLTPDGLRRTLNVPLAECAERAPCRRDLTLSAELLNPDGDSQATVDIELQARSYVGVCGGGGEEVPVSLDVRM